MIFHHGDEIFEQAKEKNVNVLFTGKGNKTNQFVGRTPYLQPVHVFSENNLTGKLLKVKICSL